MMPSRYVRQLHDHGCAIATIAMVTGAGYQNVLRRAFPRGFKKVKSGRSVDIGLTPYRMVRVIQSYGLKARVARRNWVLQNTSIMLFDWFPTTDLVSGTHAVVWVPGQSKILDPGWINNLGTDFYVRRWMEGGCSTIEIQGRID